MCFAITPNGDMLASASYDQTIRFWSIPDGRLLKTIGGRLGGVFCLVMMPDGKSLASGGSDQKIRLWSIPEGRLLNVLEGHNSSVNSLAVTPDGGLLASAEADDPTIRLWRLREPTEIQSVETSPIYSGGYLTTPLNEKMAKQIVKTAIPQLSSNVLHWAEDVLQHKELLSPDEFNWLELLVTMVRWLRRFDIEISESLPPAMAGEFDIEIDG